MKKILYLFIGISIGFTSCETDADIEIPAQDPKLVVTAFLEPEAELQILNLYMSDPIFDGSEVDNASMIENATVTISDGSKTVRIFYNFNYFGYVLFKDSMTIEHNKVYTVNVDYEGKNANTTITTVSNTPLNSAEVKIDSLIQEDPFSGDYITYFGYVKWEDPPNETNYYCIELFGLVKGDNNDTSRVSLSDFYNNVYLSDEGKNGSMMNATLEVYMYNPEFMGNQYVGFEILLTKTDEHYYKYFKSLQNYGGDDPFSEPSLIYTNINNGLGLIGSYKPYSFRKAL